MDNDNRNEFEAFAQGAQDASEAAKAEAAKAQPEAAAQFAGSPAQPEAAAPFAGAHDRPEPPRFGAPEGAPEPPKFASPDSAPERPPFGAQPTPPPYQQGGQYNMTRPANGTTYFRPDAPRGAEWSNTGSYAPRPYGEPYGSRGPAQPTYGGGQAAPWSGAQSGGTQNANAQSARPAEPYAVRHEIDRDKRADKSRGKSGAVIAIVAVICALGVILSGVAAYFAAAAGSSRSSESTKKTESPKTSDNAKMTEVQSEDGTVVLYRSVSTDSEAESTATVADVVNAVADSVVEITTEFRSTGFWQFVESGAGSGVIISDDGYIVTNNHVITNNGKIADSINVRLRDGTSYDAKVIGRDADEDVAIIKIEATGLTAAVFGDSSKLVVGEDIVAIGNPLGELGGTVTEGIISALDRDINVDGTNMNLLQISAAINPGNSGGGLFNMKGELVGIVNAKSYGSNIEGLGFAIPANDVTAITEDLMTHGYVTGKAYLGITPYYADNAYTAYRVFGSEATGVYIYSLERGYNDDVLKPGDRIAEFDGKEIVTKNDLLEALKAAKIGTKVPVVVYRNGSRVEVEVKIFEYVPSDDAVDFGG